MKYTVYKCDLCEKTSATGSFYWEKIDKNDFLHLRVYREKASHNGSKVEKAHLCEECHKHLAAIAHLCEECHKHLAERVAKTYG